MKFKPLIVCCALALPAFAGAAFGGNAEAGKRLAQLRCAACHIVAPGARNEVAEAPPFAIIARQFNGDLDALVFNLTGPHEHMNFSLSPSDAADIAEYIRTLMR